jgi:hypothetical protein
MQDQNIQWFGRGAEFSKAEKESMTVLLYYAKNLGTSVNRYWDDERKNVGRSRIIDYTAEIVENTMLSMKETLATALFDTNVSNPLAINSIPSLFPTDATSGTIGGLSRSTNSYLQHNTIDMSSDSVDTLLLDRMTTMYNNCSTYIGNGAGPPNIIVTTQDIYESFEQEARDVHQIHTNRSVRVSLGFGDLMFKNVEMFWDPRCPATNMYFLNTDTLEFGFDPNNWFEMSEWVRPSNSLDSTALVVAVGQLMTNMPRKNGVIHGIGLTP